MVQWLIVERMLVARYIVRSHGMTSGSSVFIEFALQVDVYCAALPSLLVGYGGVRKVSDK